jgi:hypothetical protein
MVPAQPAPSTPRALCHKHPDVWAARFRRTAGRCGLVLAVMLAAGCTGALSTQIVGSPSPDGSSAAPPTLNAASAPPSASAPASVVPSGTPGAPVFGQEQIEPIGRTVPAGGTVNVPLAFEGTTKAAIAIYLNDENVVATIGGVALVAGGAGPIRFLQTTLENPVDQPLTITNNGTKPTTVAIMTSIWTSRRLTVTAPVSLVGVGGTLLYSIDLTEPRADDQVSVTLHGTDGDVSGDMALSVSPDGPGRWTGDVTLSKGGSFVIIANTSGARYRIGGQQLSVFFGNVVFGEGFDERLEDTDRDGLAEALVLSPTLIVKKPGTYRVNASIADGDGQQVTNTGTSVVAEAVGTYTFDLEFGGTFIRRHGRPGPYELVELSVFDEHGSLVSEDRRDTLGTTAAHLVDQFERE